MFENSSRWLRRKMTWSKHNEQTKPIGGKGGAILWNMKGKKWSGICYLFFYQGSTMWSDKLHVLEPRWDPVRGFRFLIIWKKKKKRKRRGEWKNKDILWNSHHLCSTEAGMSCPQMKTFKNSTFHWVSYEGALGPNRCTISRGYMAGR